ncbi:hypothetical protein GCM10027289_17480 [Tsukamurella serpentis]
MTESTGSQPENTAADARPAPQEQPAPSGASKKLLVAGIVFGLIGLGGVSFTAGYWVGHEGDGGHRGKIAEQRFGKHQGDAEGRVDGSERREHRRDGAQRPAPPSSAAPSTPATAPGA